VPNLVADAHVPNLVADAHVPNLVATKLYQKCGSTCRRVNQGSLTEREGSVQLTSLY
jgi:hypothetical protein